MFPITLLTLIFSAYTKSCIPIFGQAHIKSDPSPVCIYLTYFFQECVITGIFLHGFRNSDLIDVIHLIVTITSSERPCW